MQHLPLTINGGCSKGGHVQGIAIDVEKGFAYFSFTTELIKTDLLGNRIGSVKGLVGHLGCIDFNRDDGKVYGSLEFKNDSIGKGIFKNLGLEGVPVENSFYIAIFDVDKIDRFDMDAEADGVMTAVYLPQVTEYYEGKSHDGREHRYACSGIDGTAFGPDFGAGKDTPSLLMVACGIYRDNEREDNDNQMIFCYDWCKFAAVARPLSQKAPHHSALLPERTYFFYTGNTDWGVQNLCYDSYTGNWFVCVYKGSKPQFPNYTTYLIDGAVAPVLTTLKGLGGEQGLLLAAAADGVLHEESGVRGFRFKWGSTGIHSLGDGRFYFSHNGRTPEPERLHTSVAHLYRYTGEGEDGFVPITE
ncbi:MAG: hypothetical protein E7590_00430 [Ruminococcaceae bacterium]|nr:hypothetical protein [Oscillospiraceae bacterium]